MNGCGPEGTPKWLKFLLFDWMFHASCNKHDEGYQKGGTWKDKVKCDLKFLMYMYFDILRAVLIAIHCVTIGFIVAPLMFLGVLIFGGYRFGK